MKDFKIKYYFSCHQTLKKKKKNTLWSKKKKKHTHTHTIPIATPSRSTGHLPPVILSFPLKFLQDCYTNNSPIFQNLKYSITSIVVLTE